MGKTDLGDFFESYLEKESFFKDKNTLQTAHTPESIQHRDDQIKTLANILAPSLRMERPSNLFLYGKTGTGKTLCAQHTTKQIADVAQKRDIPIKVVYLNCKLRKVADTEYRLLAQLIKEFGLEVPATGLPTDELYNIFIRMCESKKQLVILILDEIDQLVKKTGDGVIYNLTRLNSELKQSQISFLGISNDLNFTDAIDPRVKSSLSEEEIVFPPYNALQIQSILKDRANIAFREGVMGAGVVEKCAALAAREHGDVRRAIDLLRVAGEIAEREQEKKLHIRHIDQAEEKVERDTFSEVVATQPKQQQATLYAILKLSETASETIYTGDVYDLYKRLCEKVGLRPLTQRRVSDVIAEFDMLGLINAKVISKGRFGRTKEITLATSKQTSAKIKKILQESLDLAH